MSTKAPVIVSQSVAFRSMLKEMHRGRHDETPTQFAPLLNRKDAPKEEKVAKAAKNRTRNIFSNVKGADHCNCVARNLKLKAKTETRYSIEY